MPQYDFEGRWECTTGGSNKFYEIHFSGRHFVCSWGKIGTAGTSIRYDYTQVMKKVRAFASKGYRKVGRGVRPTESQANAIPIFEPPQTKSRLASVEKEEEIVIKAPTKTKEKKFVPTGRLSSIQ